MKPHILYDDERDRRELAYVHAASTDSVVEVLDAGVDDDGRSGWHWLRLPNGDLMLGVFPRGETYFSVEIDAAFPGAGE